MSLGHYQMSGDVLDLLYLRLSAEVTIPDWYGYFGNRDIQSWVLSRGGLRVNSVNNSPLHCTTQG